MRLGIAFAPAVNSIRPDEMGRAVEERGFDLLLATEHTHVPVALKSANPTGGEVPEEYRSLFDQMIWLAAAAMATSRLVVSSGITLVAQHDPIHLAKQVATIDRLCEGRMMFAWGYGWQIEEAANHGVDPRKRRAIAREKVLAMRQMWVADIASFQGEHVSITPSWIGPKPLQVPHPPVFLGAGPGPTAFRHIAEFCDGWLIRYDAIPREIAELRRVAESAGRDPQSLRLGVHRATPTLKALEAQCERGAEFATLGVKPGGRDDVLRQLDELAELASAFPGEGYSSETTL